MMHTGFYNLVTVLLEGDDDTPVPDEAIAKSNFLQAAFTLNLARIVVPAVQEMNTTNLGELWKDISPVDGKYNIEIATVLPYYLPDFDKLPEYVVDVDGAELIVSSRMLRCFFTDENGQTDPLQYYLVHRRGLKSLCEQRKLSHTHPVPLHTFVSKRFVVTGDSAKQIVQNQFNAWRNEFVGNLSRFLDSIRAASPKDAKHLLPQAGVTFLSMFWLCLQGADGKVGIEQFAGDMPSAAFRSLSKLSDEAVERARKFLAQGGAISIQDSALALAETYLHYGYLGLALVQVSIACESALAQTYETFLTSRGVSKTKYAEAERDITYSQLLNLHLAAARDLSQFANHEILLGRLNWARKRRNDVVHKGKFEENVSAQDVENAIEAARALIQFLFPTSQAVQASS